MYDPALPNNYREVKITSWKRAREEEQANDISRALAAAPTPAAVSMLAAAVSINNNTNNNSNMNNMNMNSNNINIMSMTTTGNSPGSGSSSPPFELTPESSPNIGGEILPFQLSAEELHQRRVRQSAALGISTAMKIERDELEAAHKVKVASGMDRKGRIGQRLGKLMEVASSQNNNNNQSGIGGGVSSNINSNSNNNCTTTTTTGDGTPQLPSLPMSSAPLKFQRTDLAAGGYVVKEDISALEKKKTVQGKPSSTILIRFIRDGPPPEVFAEDNSNNNNNTTTISSSNNMTMNNGVAVRNAFLESIQEQCGRCGVVRSIRYVLLNDEERAMVRSRLSAIPECDVETRLAREVIRIFVRFDSVANAFKALEVLQQKCVQWDVCFFPTQLFDAGSLGPSEGEPLCAV